MALSAVVSLFTITGCSDSEPETTPKNPEKKTIVFDGGNIPAPVLEESGGTGTVVFTASSSWTASADESRAVDWLSVSPTSGQAGKVTLTITAQPNTGYDERNGAVTIVSDGFRQVFTVTQKQTDAMILSSDKVEVGAGGETVEIALKSNVDVSCRIAEEDAGWIKASVSSRGLTDRTFAFDISPNESVKSRTGHIGVSGAGKEEIVTVYQSGEEPSLILGEEEAVVSASGGEVTVEIASNVEFTSVISKGADWLNESEESTRSSYTLRYTVAPNETYDERTAKIEIASAEYGLSRTFTVTQVAAEAIVVAKKEYNIGSEGGELNFDIETNLDIDPEVSCDADWIHRVEARSRALRVVPLCFDIDANPTPEESRSAVITIKNPNGNSPVQTVTVTQASNMVIKSEIEPVVVYMLLNDAGRFGDYARSLLRAFCGVVKNTYTDGHTEEKIVNFGRNNLYQCVHQAFWGIRYSEEFDRSSIPPRTTSDGSYYSDLTGNRAEEALDDILGFHGEGKQTQTGYHIDRRFMMKEISTPGDVRLTRYPMDVVEAMANYNSRGTVPKGVSYIKDGEPYYIWKSGKSWRGLYNAYTLTVPFGFTEQEIEKFESYFGVTAENLPLNRVNSLTVEHLVKILGLENEPEPYKLLPAGLYSVDPFDSHLPVGFVDDNTRCSWFFNENEPYTFFYNLPDDFACFAIISEEMEGFDGKRHFVETPREIGELKWDYKTKVIEDNDVRRVQVVTLNWEKEYLFENAPGVWPSGFNAEKAGYNTDNPEWRFWAFPSMKLSETATDTLVYYKPRPDLPLRVKDHILYPGATSDISIRYTINKEFLGRKVLVNAPAWLDCDKEFTISENFDYFHLNLPPYGPQALYDYVYFTLEGEEKPFESVKVVNAKDNSISRSSGNRLSPAAVGDTNREKSNLMLKDMLIGLPASKKSLHR